MGGGGEGWGKFGQVREREKGEECSTSQAMHTLRVTASRNNYSQSGTCVTVKGYSCWLAEACKSLLLLLLMVKRIVPDRVLERWLCEGVVSDPYAEFMVQEHKVAFSNCQPCIPFMGGVGC